MRMSMLIGAIAFAISAPAIAAHPQDGAINAVYARLAAARAAHDVPGMAAAFGGEGLLIDQRPQPALSGAELAARLEPMAARLRADNVSLGTAYRVERRSVMDDLAVDAGYMRQQMHRPGGQQMTRYARFLVTMRRQGDGSWRIIADASMPAEEAAWTALTAREGLHFDD